MAEPFLGSLLAVSAALGVPSFVFVQWVAPFVSRVPGEGLGLLLGAHRGPGSDGADEHGVEQHQPVDPADGHAADRLFVQPRACRARSPFDDQQELELLMTLGQSLVGMIFLVNMKLAWWEAAALFVLWAIQFAFSPVPPGPGVVRCSSLPTSTSWVTWAYFVVGGGRDRPDRLCGGECRWRSLCSPRCGGTGVMLNAAAASPRYQA